MNWRIGLSLMSLMVGCSRTPPVAEIKPLSNSLPADHPPINLPEAPLQGLAGRAPVRLSVAQLRKSLEAVTGGVGWKETLNGVRDVDMLQYLANTLGEADFAEVTQENREPGILFAKFAADGARKVCSDVLKLDATRQRPQKVIMRHVAESDTPQSNMAAVMKNIAYLRFRFLGDDEADSPKGADSALVFSEALRFGATPTEAWLGVCVSLLSDPQFIAY